MVCMNWSYTLNKWHNLSPNNQIIWNIRDLLNKLCICVQIGHWKVCTHFILDAFTEKCLKCSHSSTVKCFFLSVYSRSSEFFCCRNQASGLMEEYNVKWAEDCTVFIRIDWGHRFRHFNTHLNTKLWSKKQSPVMETFSAFNIQAFPTKKKTGI